MVQVVLKIPALPNTIPLVSTTTLDDINHHNLLGNPESAGIVHPCSNLNLKDGRSLLSHTLRHTPGQGVELHHTPIHSHLNSSSCQWEFSAWYPVQTLLYACGGGRPFSISRAPSGQISLHTVTLRLNTIHVHFGPEGPKVVANSTSPVVITKTFPSLSNSSYLPPPLHILSQESHDSVPYVFPVSISREADLLTIFFHSTAPSNYWLVPSNTSLDNLELLFVDMAMNTEVWLLQQTVTLTSTARNTQVQLLLTASEALPCDDGCALPDIDYTFSMPLMLQDEAASLLLNTSVIPHTDTITIGM